jgi:hypothetical protein
LNWTPAGTVNSTLHFVQSVEMKRLSNASVFTSQVAANIFTTMRSVLPWQMVRRSFLKEVALLHSFKVDT